jgi:hypothetical protein
MKGLCHICFASNVELTLCKGIMKCFACYEAEKCKEDIKLD